MLPATSHTIDSGDGIVQCLVVLRYQTTSAHCTNTRIGNLPHYSWDQEFVEWVVQNEAPLQLAVAPVAVAPVAVALFVMVTCLAPSRTP
jgi:hypothetical protein